MAAKKRGQLSMNFDSERVSKLFGVFLLFLSFYFFIAFTSYFFTWKNDHDVVFRFSWDVFFDDVPVDNWLGRLGAFLSDSIIYWGFGIASYGFVYLLYKYGLAFIRRTPLGYLNSAFQRTIILMTIASVLCSFFLQKLEFPWGGVFGQAISEYIQNFIGVVGTLALMLFALIATFVWSNNPDLTEFTWQKLWDETKQAWNDLLAGNFGKRKPAAGARQTRTSIFDESPIGSPEVKSQTNPSATVTATVGGPAATDLGGFTDGQLALDLSQRSALFADPDSPAFAKAMAGK
ncbi:MAG: DNA translocase FtsK 4TM domain-containing protein, partial [Saprospiraceae bacterium]|nr:DNA translocase FtsK 4TM domain-containing protein [Saprospiraceae bacterium]